MLTRDALIGNVLAATDKLVQQVGQGDWSSVAKTVEQRHMFLEALSSSQPQTGEHDFLKAMRDAVAESDAAVAVMSRAQSTSATYTPSSSNAANSSPLTYGPGKR